VSTTVLEADISVDAVMTELRGRIRERLRAELLRHGTSPALEDPALFADVERVLHDALEAGDRDLLILPELLGDPETWRLDTSMRYQSHRGAVGAAAARFMKQRIIMPAVRWLFEYSRDNFERQRRVNQALFAVVQELALETARLRQELQRSSPPASTTRPDQ